MRRFWRMLFLACTLAVLLAGCAGQTGETGTAAAEQQESAAEQPEEQEENHRQEEAAAAGPAEQVISSAQQELLAEEKAEEEPEQQDTEPPEQRQEASVEEAVEEPEQQDTEPPEQRQEVSVEKAMEESGQQDTEPPEQEEEHRMKVEVGGSSFTATLEDNTAAQALAELLEQQPLTIQMSDYAGFEKVGELGQSLPASDSQTTTGAGDIVLYQGDQIVIFYGSNSWSYTRLGHIDDLTGWEQALGSGAVSVTFSLEE